MEQGKIFGIGYPKTATSSLSNALAKLGYRSAHDPYDILPAFFPDELQDIEYDPGKQLNITASIGIASIDTAKGYESCLQQADEALYEAKHSGRNRVCLKQAG